MIHNDSLFEIITRCWFDTTGMPIEPVDSKEASLGGDLYIATVVFSGKEQGSLTIAMGEALAKAVAAGMFNALLDTITFDDIKDSIGELANVLAGNMKTDFFGSSELSRPIVLQGSESFLAAFQVDAIFQRLFICGDREQLLIQVCQVN